MKKLLPQLLIFLIYINTYSQIDDFQEHIIIDNTHVTINPTSIYNADLDGDGDLDVLCSLYGNITDEGNIAWYENIDSKGNFSQQKKVTSDADGAMIAYPADIDGDGDLDIVSTSELDHKIAWYENTDGKGNFSTQKLIATQDEAQIAFGTDIDNDGDIDILFTSRYELAWVENIDGNGSFSAKKIIGSNGQSFSSIFPADMDGDGDIDILSTTRGSGNKVTWFENIDGIGNFATPVTIDATARGASSVYAGDIDGDGDLDAIVAAHNNNDILWYENTDGEGNFSSKTITSNFSGVAKVFLDDIDNDGDLDVIAASDATSQMVWYENTDGKGNFSLIKLISDVKWASSMHTSDIDGDGDIDLCKASFKDHELVWYENTDSRGNFSLEKMITRNVTRSKNVIGIDLDGDGDQDVISTSDNGRVAWYENLDGIGNFGLQKVIASGRHSAYAVLAVDIDSDGDNDIIAEIAGYPTNKIVWYENINGLGDFSEEKKIESEIRSTIDLAIDDLDGDGDIDIIACSASDRFIVWYENKDGNGNFESRRIIQEDVNRPVTIHTSDLDNDGDIDISYGNNNQIHDGFYWLENVDGNGNFGAPKEISDHDDYTRDITSVDIDNDGDLDIMGCADKIVIFENIDGMGTFDFKNHVAFGIDIKQALAIDMDGDGDFDIVNGFLGWYENLDGEGESFSDVKFIAETSGTFISSSDIDNDGDTDILVAASTKVYWIENLINETLLAVNEFENSKINIFPIPSNDLISILNPQEININKVIVYSIEGSKVLVKEKNFDTISIQNLSSGIYFLKLITDAGEFTKKIIKE